MKARRFIQGGAARLLLFSLVFLFRDQGFAQGSDEEFIAGINGHAVRNGGVYHVVSLEKQIHLLKELGATWYRCDVALTGNYQKFEELIKIAEENHITILPVLFPDFEPAKEGSLKAVEEKAFQQTKAFVERYRKHFRVWELSNELDGYAILKKGDVLLDGRRWTFESPDGRLFDHYDKGRMLLVSALLRGMSKGVRSADPSAQRIIDSAGWLHLGFVEHLKRAGIEYEIVGWHWYSDMGDIQDVAGFDMIRALEAYGKPIWMTEVGFRSEGKEMSEAPQAKYFLDSIAKFAAIPAVKAYFVYELLDEPELTVPGEAHYGLAMAKVEKGVVEFAKKMSFYSVKRAFEDVDRPLP